MRTESRSERGTGADERVAKAVELEVKLRYENGGGGGGVSEARKETLYFTNKILKYPWNETFSPRAALYRARRTRRRLSRRGEFLHGEFVA